jgi:transmembrane sensor
MSDPLRFDIALLDRCLAGAASDADRVAVQAWSASDPRNAALLAAVQAHALSSAAPVDTDSSWRELRARLAQDAVTQPTASLADYRGRPPSTNDATRISTPGWSERRGRVARIAAAIVLAVGGTTLWQRTHSSMHELSAPLARRRTITLDDGTKVVLAPGSRLQWRGTLREGAREIALDGEAYFDVVHDAARPFRVRAGRGLAEDIGTRFVVRAWPELAATEVAVEEGVVALSVNTRRTDAPRTVLRAGTIGRISAAGTVAVAAEGDAALAWMHDELVFDDTPLDEALPAISRWYDVELRADSTLRGRRLTARFTQQPLPDLLAALSLALDAQVDRQGSVVIFRPSH